MIAFALLNIYVEFQIPSVFADVRFLSESHVSAVLGQNLPK